MKFLDKIFVSLILMQGSWVVAKTHLSSSVAAYEYIENQLKCQITLADLRWSYNLWPNQNKQSKPKRQAIQTDEDILNKIENDLVMSAVYKRRFNQEISPQMLQAELNRMVASTQDAVRLQALFKALGNNPTAIAECVARPNILLKKFTSSYQWDASIHRKTREQAEVELQSYMQNQDANIISGNIYQLEYRLKSSATKTNKIHESVFFENKLKPIELKQDDFVHKLRALVSQKHSIQLQETNTAYIYEEMINSGSNEIKTQVIVWKKTNFDQWWKALDKTSFKLSYPESKFKYQLLEISKNNKFNAKNMHLGFTDAWEYNGNVPDARVYHSAVWTGNEMIVWGGRVISVIEIFNTGGRYDPVTDSWREITIVNAPSMRYSHSGLWTGSKMIIWGGKNPNYLNNGSLYDPVNDVWTVMTLVNAPLGREKHSTIWTGTEMIVWGGFNIAIGNSLNSGGIYNPSLNTWRSINLLNSPSIRYSHTAVWANNEMIVWGGTTGFGAEKNDGARYNPVGSGTWTTLPSANAPSVRSNHSAIWTGSEMIIWGGEGNGTSVNNGKIYNPTNNNWTNLVQSNAPSARFDHTAVWTGTKMLIWGGGVFGSNSLNNGAVYDVNTASWTSMSTNIAPIGRTLHSAIWSGSEMIIWGGKTNTNAVFNSGGRYNLANNSWQATNQHKEPLLARTDFTSTWTGNEMIIWGGKAAGIALNTGGKYNPVTASWSVTSLTNAPPVRYQHTAIWTGTDMHIWGGTDGFVSGSVNNLSTGSRYNPVIDEWTAIQDLTGGARRLHTAVWSGSTMIIFGGVGGNDGNTVLKLVSIYNPSPTLGGWGTISSPSAPEARFFHTAVWLNGEMIVWGGEGITGSLNSGGRYNTSSGWTATNLSNAPTARRYQTAISTDSKMIIWGGLESNFQTNYDTGAIYDPINDSWIATPTINAPSPRALHSAVWTGSEMIVWGGVFSDNFNEISYDTGARFNPASNSWTTTSTTAVAPARYNHKTVWTGDKMLVWGGQTGGTELSDLGIYTPYIPIPEEIFTNSFE